jgi:hypothetical protein
VIAEVREATVPADRARVPLAAPDGARVVQRAHLEQRPQPGGGEGQEAPVRPELVPGVVPGLGGLGKVGLLREQEDPQVEELTRIEVVQNRARQLTTRSLVVDVQGPGVENVEVHRDEAERIDGEVLDAAAANVIEAGYLLHLLVEDGIGDVQRRQAQLVRGRVVELPGAADQAVDLALDVEELDLVQEGQQLAARLVADLGAQLGQDAQEIAEVVLQARLDPLRVGQARYRDAGRQAGQE